MKLPLSWLNDYVDISDVDYKILADKLVHIGFEVEEIVDAGAGLTDVYVGKIVSMTPHPDAVKLQVCKVDLGKKTLLQIVTGAKNVHVGDIVPVAVDGAALVGGKRITTSPLRGVLSEGMFCGGSELGVDNTVIQGASDDGVLILPSDTKLGADIKDVLGLNDIILDISVTANRPDCQSVYGLAREIAVMLAKPLKPLNLSYAVKKGTRKLAVDIEDAALCSRYTGRIIENVKIADSPDWLKRRLRLMGLKPINNVVDITNYVLLEVGQPLHAFDIRRIDERIRVRRAKKNEKIKLLDGSEYAMTESMLVIADNAKPLALAGVMGGEYSGIASDTQTVFLESARFARGSVRATSRALGIKSDSSARFEKGVDYESVDTGRERALALFALIDAGEITDLRCDNSIPRPKDKVIVTSAKQICGVLGVSIPKQRIVGILSALGVKVKDADGKLSCSIPLYREDIDSYPDLAEEVIRFYGYGKIKSTMFKSGAAAVGGYSARDQKIRAVKLLMTGFGAQEIITYSFINPKQYDKLNVPKNDTLRDTIRILNPLSEDYSVMRTQLTGGMLNAVKLNISRKNEKFRLFEIARTYCADSLPIKKLPDEYETLCAAYVGRDEDFYSIKAAVTEVCAAFKIDFTLQYTKCAWLHPGIGADIVADHGNTIGYFGKIHPVVAKNFDISEDVYIAEICLESLMSMDKTATVRYVNLPKYPAVDRDLAVTVAQRYSVGELSDCIKHTAGGLCERVELFDIYTGAQIEQGYKSIAFSIRLRDTEKTLNDALIQETMSKIVVALKEKFGAVLRA